MSGHLLISFSLVGELAPVYAVTSASNPSWEPIQMKQTPWMDDGGNPIFALYFPDIAEGVYQYKIRVGEDHWLVDYSKETIIDGNGNLNNVVRTRPITDSINPPWARHYNAGSGTLDQPVPAAQPTRAYHPPDGTDPQKRWGYYCPTPSLKSAPSLHPEQEQARQEGEQERQDSVQLPSVPVPFVVVDKAKDQKQPEYGDIAPGQLPAADDLKRAADADPDYESDQSETLVNSKHLPDTASVPALVVEKVDGEPSFGDDFGNDATYAQKVAHDQRAEDAAPDQVIVNQGSHSRIEPGTEDERAASLLRHETLESTGRSSSISTSSSTESAPIAWQIKIESFTPSAYQARFESVPYTPLGSSGDEDHEYVGEQNSFDVLRISPLFPHKTPSSGGSSQDELTNGPLLSHETGPETRDELNNGSLMRHETEIATGNPDLGELDLVPLMSHETDLSRHHANCHHSRTENISDGDGPHQDVESGIFDFESDDGVGTNEMTRVPTFSHENTSNEHAVDETPLLAHERSGTPSEASIGDDRDIAHQIMEASPIFGRRYSSRVFKPRSNSSNLPHRLPRCDEDDENLLDPSLEAFPINRDQILQRVATIGDHLPEDQTSASPTGIHSPDFTVVSQACSSVDLAPIGSHTSLQAITEDDVEEVDEEDAASLPSPALEIASRGDVSGQASSFQDISGSEDRKTPMPAERQPGATQESGSFAAGTSSEHDGETVSIQRTDGAQDTSKHWSVHHKASLKENKPLTPPKTNDLKNVADKQNAGHANAPAAADVAGAPYEAVASAQSGHLPCNTTISSPRNPRAATTDSFTTDSETSELRRRHLRTPTSNPMAADSTPPRSPPSQSLSDSPPPTPDDSRTPTPPALSATQQEATGNGNGFLNFMRAVFGPIAQLFGACFGWDNTPLTPFQKIILVTLLVLIVFVAAYIGVAWYFLFA